MQCVATSKNTTNALKNENSTLKMGKLPYLPYLVLIVDEFADLIMTAGKEVEAPIARLAQLASSRNPPDHCYPTTICECDYSVIKANFPARVAFQVTSRIDSRTILDSGGAEQLIGRGDMLYTQAKRIDKFTMRLLIHLKLKN